jgi:hypothetical protein
MRQARRVAARLGFDVDVARSEDRNERDEAARQ